MNKVSVVENISVRATINKWIMATFPHHRIYISHESPVFDRGLNRWKSILATKNINGHTEHLGKVLVTYDGDVVLDDRSRSIEDKIDELLEQQTISKQINTPLKINNLEFHCGDGIEGLKKLKDRQIDLLLTDPPYGISKAYACERQVPRRLRTNGRDFIMPKGNFGNWDTDIVCPKTWMNIALPKVRGWFVSFCSQAQIGEYQGCLHEHGFNSIGTLVWQKTNPVPFNIRFKPVNAWEAVVIGKRPSTKFHNKGKTIHNIFVSKSPSPQQRIHPTQKPLGLMEDFIELFSIPSALVVDPFSGSGTMVLAALKKGRKAIGYEKNQKIYQAAAKRIINGKT